MKLMMVGDICPTAATRPAFDAKDPETLMGDALPLLKNADFTIGNLECALTDGENRIRKCGPNLKGKPEDAAVLKACGFTHLGLSNNHTLDFGISGLRDTIAHVEKAGIVSFGYGENEQDSRRPVYFSKDGMTVAIVAVCEHQYSYALPDQMGVNPFDAFETMEEIAQAKKKSDFVLVMFHGGKEHCEVPSPRLRRACRAMIRAGASLVLMQHSHCIGCRESYRDGEILYGQGNFNFVKYMDRPCWKSGLMASVLLENEAVRVEYIPVVTTDTGIRLARGAEKDAILADFAQRSEDIRDEARAEKMWEDFCAANRKNVHYDDVLAGFGDPENPGAVRQVFAHYMDCDAVLDIWKTLFKTWHAEKTSGADGPRE